MYCVCVCTCVNACLFVQRAIFSGLQPLVFVDNTFEKIVNLCSQSTERLRVMTAELEQIHCLIYIFCLSLLLSFLFYAVSVCDMLYLSSEVVVRALACDIEMVSDRSRRFSQYSQRPSCHSFLSRNRFALLTFILKQYLMTN